MSSEWAGLVAIVIVAGCVAMWNLSTLRRAVIIMVFVPTGGVCALQMERLVFGIALLALPTLVLLLAFVVFGLLKSKRVEALSALASAAMLWVGFMGVLLVWS